MNLVTCTGSFLLGGASAVMIMRLLFHFLQPPRKRVSDDQFLKEIADALLPGPEFKQPAERLKVKGAETAGTLEMRPEKGVSTGHPVAARRLDLGYTPISELH
jgi:hypothetical protein